MAVFLLRHMDDPSVETVSHRPFDPASDAALHPMLAWRHAAGESLSSYRLSLLCDQIFPRADRLE